MVLGFRWRRDAWLVGSVVLAVVIVGTAAVVGSEPRSRPEPSTRSSASSPHALPYDRVGRADVVYACVQGCRPMVAFADGREFEVPTDAPSTRDITLSPDGRWLGYPLGTDFIVRDLLGTDEHRLGVRAANRRIAAWAWSADSSLLLLGELRDGEPEAFDLLHLRDGTRTPVVAWPGHQILGVRPPAELLMVQPGVVSGTRFLAGLGDELGTISTWFTVDASQHLRPGERLEPTSLRFRGAGFEVVAVGTDSQPVAVLHFGGDFGGGGAVRHDLSTPGLSTPDPGRWSVLGTGEDGRAFVRNGQGRTALWFLTPDGTLRPGRDLTGDAVVVAPGTARN